MKSKVIELAKKLKALAERGVGGEKVNAARMLDELLDKHGISYEEVEEDTPHDELFKYKTGQRPLLMQVMAGIIGGKLVVYGTAGRRNAVIVSCTKSEFIEIEQAFSFYQAEYDKTLKVFFSAFVQRNELFAKDGKAIHASELSSEEKQHLHEVMKMVNVLDKKIYTKQLEQTKS